MTGSEINRTARKLSMGIRITSSKHRRGNGGSNRRSGAMLVFLAILLPTILVLCAYVINVSYMELARTELQISIDLASRAAARTLAISENQSQAIDDAQRVLDANPCLNKKIELTSQDFIFGVATRYREEDRYTFRSGTFPNAVKLEGQRTIDLPIAFPMAGIPLSFRPLKSTTAAQPDLDIAIVLDRSTSMTFSSVETSNESVKRAKSVIPPAPAPANSRWSRMNDAIANILSEMSKSSREETVSLTTFSDNASLDVPLTTQYQDIRYALSQHSMSFPGGKSNVTSGISQGGVSLGQKKAAKPWATRLLLLVSDGLSTSSDDPVLAAKIVASEGIMIFTITCSSDANVGLMSRIASEGKGKHFHSPTAAEFLDAFSEISRSMPTIIIQ
ncbi:MAG: VWA domain-containing protein [Planctomycetes bacterium]|nr:VWA domain-containing protein [Planctomycetota bacterium]